MIASLLRPSFKTGFARSASESANPHLWRGLIGAWVPSMGVTGNILHDVSTFKNHGTLTNMDAGTDWIIGKNGYALDFAGDDDYVDIGKKLDSLDLSVFVEIERNGTGTIHSITSRYDTGSAQRSWALNITDLNQIEAVVSKNGSVSEGVSSNIITSFSTVTDSNKHYIGFTYNFLGDGTSDFILYFDGPQVASNLSAVGPIFNGSENIVIGKIDIAGVPSRHFNGQIGQVLIHNRVLTPNEVYQLYIDPLAPFRLRDRFAGISIAAPPPSGVPIFRRRIEGE